MQRPIIYTFLCCCLIGLTSAGYSLFWPRPAPEVTVRDQQVDTLVDSHMLWAAYDYDLFIRDSIRVSPDDSLTWYIQKRELTGPKEVDFQLNEAVREWKFRDTGYYDVHAYLDLKEVGHSLMHVIDGDRFEVQWGPELEKALGTSFDFRDASTNVAKRAWTISRAGSDETVASGENVNFEWTPPDTGTYIAHVKVEFRSGKVERSQETLAVMPPPKAEPKLVVVVPQKPKPAKKWEPPVRETPPPPIGSASCFPTTVRTEGSSFMIKVDKPARAQVEFHDEATVFKISPKYDCMFTGFEYFATGKIDNIEITIECLNKDCVGKNPYKFKFKGTLDAYDAAKASFTSAPILNKDFEYRITVKAASPGQLGFFPLATNIFKPEKQGNTFRMSEASISFSDLRTCIFNLRFVR